MRVRLAALLLLATLAGCVGGPSGAPSPPGGATGCTPTPAQTEGPYFVDGMPERSDLRADSATGAVRDGAPLRLVLTADRAAGRSCAPVAGARVDVWHADARGAYSGVEAQRGTDFLRGHQTTGASGTATFSTIYPGWYPGRSIHIHVKVRSSGTAPLTTQLYADDAVNDAVMARAPYAARGAPDTRNAQDGIFRGNGAQLLMNVTSEGPGYTGTFRLVLP